MPNNIQFPAFGTPVPTVSPDEVLNGIAKALEMVQGLGYVIVIGAKGDPGNLKCRTNVSRAQTRAMLRTARDAMSDGRIVLPE